MVSAAKDLVLILVDLTDRNTNSALADKYGVKGLPAMYFTDSDGKVVGELEDRSPDGIVRQFGETAEKYTKSVPWVKTLDAGLTAATKGEKPLILFLTDEGADAKVTEAAFIDDSLKKLIPEFVFVRHVIEPRCETCRRFRMTKGTRVLVLNPKLEKPAKSPFKKLNGKQTAAKLKKAFDYSLKRWKRFQEKAQAAEKD